MAIIHVTPKSSLKGSNRFDAEYYQEKYISIENAIKSMPYTCIGKEKEAFSKGIFDIKSSTYVKKGIPFVRISNLNGVFVDNDDIAYITEEAHVANNKTALYKHDIILSKTAIPCASISYFETCNCSQDTIAFRVKKRPNVKPQVIVTYLNTKYGYPLMERLFTGNIQMHLNLNESKDIPIPLFGEDFQTMIEQFIDNAYLKLENAKKNYFEAENLLYEELGLIGYTPTKNHVSIRMLSESFAESGRLDAEYYHLKYDELFQIIKKNANSIKYICEIQTFNARGLQPVYENNGELNVINSKHILEHGLDYDNFEKTNISYWDTQQRSRVYNNDMLIYTTGAYIGRTAVYMKDEKALASNHVNILRVNYPNSIYIAFVLNSLIGRMQTEKLSAGSAQQELYPKDIEKFYIPFISEKNQISIMQKIQNHFALSAESTAFIEYAKQAVEMAIEHGEKLAVKWLDDKLMIQ